jgi:hypothetical protein
MKVGIVQVIFPSDEESGDTAESDDEGGFEFRNSQILSSELTSETSLTFGLEDPDSEDLNALDPSSDTLLGLWAPFLFLDANGDDVFNDGESINGFGMTWLVYSTDTIPEFNVTQGWGALEMTFSEEAPNVGDLSNVPLDANVLAVESITIGGSYDTSIGERRIGFIAAATYEAAQIETMYDGEATDPWTVTLSGTPAQNHFLDIEGAFQTAMATPMVYPDSNGNGAFDMDDLYAAGNSVLPVCYASTGGMGPMPISVMYTVGPTSFEMAMTASMYGMNSGWSVMVNTDDEPLFLSGTDLTSLTIESSCTFD